jgi:hypothetical protein
MDQGRTLSVARASGLVLVALGWALFLTLIGSPEAVLFTVPVFLLAAPLAFGRYLGEGLIEALIRRVRRLRAVPALRPATFDETFIALVEAARIPGRGPPLSAK